VVAGVFFMLLIVSTLAASKHVDHLVNGPCRNATLLVEFDPRQGKTRLAIQQIIDDYLYPEILGFESPSESTCIAKIRYCEFHRDHRAFLGELARIAEVTRVSQG
jgi:hypothetical protein